MSKEEIIFKLDNNFLKFVGKEMYQTLPSIISEMIANSWDADAKNIRVEINTVDNCIILMDDGDGMSKDDISKKYVNVGYNKRNTYKNGMTPSGRKIMGRKGIGKFAPFGVADRIKLSTAKSGMEKTGINMSYKAIVKNFKNPFYDSSLPLLDESHGTTIEISDMSSNIKLNRQVHFIHSMIFRNFLPLILSKEINVELYMDKKLVKIKSDPSEIFEYADVIVDLDSKKYKDNRNWKDGDYTKQSRLNFNRNSTEIMPMIKELKDDLEKEDIAWKDNMISGSVLAVRELKNIKSKDDESGISVSYNVFSIYANGKLGLLDMLPKIKTDTTYDRYVYGSISADFMELNDREDISISNREGYVEEEPRYIALKKFNKKLLRFVQDKKKEINKAVNNSKVENELMSKEDILENYKQIIGTKIEDKVIQKMGASYYQHLRIVKKKEVKEEEKDGVLTKKIFISHDSRTKWLGDIISNSLIESGVEAEEIFYSSSNEPASRVQFTKDFMEEIENVTRTARFTIFLASKEFYDSNMSIAEAGAIWAKESKYGLITSGGFKPDWVDIPLNDKKIALSETEMADEFEKFEAFIKTVLEYISKKIPEEKKLKKIHGEFHKEFTKAQKTNFIPKRNFIFYPKCGTCNKPMKISDEYNFTCTCTNPKITDQAIILEP